MMKKLMILSLLAASALHGFADVSFEVKNVTARQRYPWNGKVDIDFLLESSDPNAKFKVTVQCRDNVGKTNLAVRTLSYARETTMTTKFTLKGGQHWLVWNADADCPNVRLSNVSIDVFAKLTGDQDTATYMVIDISGGPNASSYPVSYITGVPAGGWTDEYKTTKIVLRRCPAGTDPLGRYSLTKDFFAGVFEITQKQWVKVISSIPYDGTVGKGDEYPVQRVSYYDIQGTGSFIARLRTKTSLEGLNLPTEAQWEYACRAGTGTTYNLGNSAVALASAGWYSGNSENMTHPVGGKTPNAWGLYDMHGNVREWCTDYGNCLIGKDPYYYSSGYCCVRGGCFLSDTAWCTSSVYSRSACDSSGSSNGIGFRLFMTVE